MSKQSFRSNIARGIEKGKQGIDRNFEHDKGKGAIFGYAVIAKGELNSGDIRNWEMDNVSMDQVVQLGNDNKIGLKSRFGHPNMSQTALGTFLGRAKNFRKEKDLVRADLYFDETAYKTPNGDLATYVMDLAENDPDAFGSSIVFDMILEHRIEKDGTPKKDEGGKELPALVRFTKLFASDMVDDPAATPGVFGSFFNSSVELSAKATEFLDKLLNNPDALEKVISFLERYRTNRVDIDVETEIKPKQTEKEAGTMEGLDKVTLQELQQVNPTLVASIENAAIASERARVLSIIKAGHLEFKGKGVEAQVEESVEKGFTLDTSLASMRGKCLADINAAGNKPPGAETETDAPKTHLQKAQAYAAEHKCSMTVALKETAEPRKK